jgi:anti-sigma-K factor RskA
MAYSEDQLALAAEYALGTLDAEERAQVETMIAADTEFAALVQTWEYRLGSLNQMVGSVEPPAAVWDNIKTAIGHAAEPQAPLLLPEAPPFPQPAPELEIVPTSAVEPDPVAPDLVEPDQVEPPSIEPPSIEPAMIDEPPLRELLGVDDRKIIQLSGRLRRARSMGLVASALAAALLVVIGMQIYRPELLPEAVRPRPRTQFVEVKPPPSAAQYVAVLQQDGNSPAFILTIDAATKNFTVRKVGAQPQPGKSFELWLISDQLPQPRSLGVIGGSEFTERPVLSTYDSGTINGATYAVTVEQAGGSPSGAPTSAPIFSGKLIESVPPPAPK